MYKPAERNFDRVQSEEARKKLDGKFNNAHDELSTAYYDHWRQGDYSVEFKGFKPSPGATAEEAKALFDELHGYIHLQRDEAIYNEIKSTNESGDDFTQVMEAPANSKGDTRRDIARKAKQNLESKGIKFDI